MNKQFWVKTGIKILIPLILLIVIILIRINRTSGDDFSLAKYVTVSVSGINGRGTAEAALDEVGIYNAVAGKGASDEERAKYESFVKTVTYNLSSDSKLSNGDVVTVTTTYDEQMAKNLGIKVDKTTRSIKIQNLKKGTLLDAFKDIQIITSGTSPYIYATYANNSENEYLQSLEYTISKSSKLSIGDKIEITCLADEKAAAEKGYYFDSLVLDYTITKADKYINDPSEMDTTIITKLTDDNIQVITDETDDTTSHMAYKVTNDNAYLYRDNNESIENLSFDRAVLGYNVSGYEQKHENYILVFYHGSLKLPTYKKDGDPYTYIDSYFCFIYYDAILTTQGEVSMGTNDPKLRYVCGTSYDEALSEAKLEIGSGYEFEDITIE